VPTLDLQEIREKRGSLLDSAGALDKIAKDESRDLTEEESVKIDEFLAEYDNLADAEKRAEKFEEALMEASRIRAAKGHAIVHPPGGPVTPPAEPSTKPLAVAIEPCRLKAFKDLQAAHDCGMWLKAVITRDKTAIQHCKDRQVPFQFRNEDGNVFYADAQTVDDDTRGGYLVPAPLAAAILEVRDRYGVTRSVADLIPMGSETLDIPKRDGGLTVYSPAEGSAITTSEATFKQVSLATTDRFTLSRISRKLLRSSVVSVADRVAREIGQAFGEQQDDEYLNGDASGTYFGETGLRPAVGAAGTYTLATTSGDTWAEIVLADFSILAGYLPERYFNMDTSWIMSRAFWSTVVQKLLLAAGGTTPADIASGVRPTLLGYPINMSEKMPTATAVSTIHCLFGDFVNASIVGERQGIEIATSDQRYFDSDEIGIRGKISYDINVHDPGDSSNAGAYVALKTGAAS